MFFKQCGKVHMPRKSAATKKKVTAKNPGNDVGTVSMNLHVIPRANEWVIVSEGSPKASSVHSTQLEAIEVARKVAKKSRGQLVVHARSGRIRAREHYWTDVSPQREPRKVMAPDIPPRSASVQAIRRAVGAAVAQSSSNSGSKPGANQKKLSTE